ncbi:MAG: hypothetical protein ACPGJV_00700 [Bacteriovoracaceae bacterium]
MENLFVKKNCSVVVYPEKGVPQFYKFRPFKFKFFLYFLPTLSLLCIVGFIFTGIYFKQIREYARMKEPEIFNKLRNENAGLESKVGELEELNSKLQSKLATGSGGKSEEGLSTLSLFQIPPGLQDTSSRPDFSIREQKLVKESRQVKFIFNIHNESKSGGKLAGHFFVLMKTPTGVLHFPDKTNSEQFQLTFNEGEYFATSRFRPVVATFNYDPSDLETNRKVLFKIIIFSRTGDLLYKRTQPMSFE